MEKCQINGISLNLDKCAFCMNYGILLMHIVCQEGLLVDPRKIITIVGMFIPTSLIEIKRFFEATNFHQRYFKKIASKVASICKLLKKDELFVWDETCNESFEWMRTSMTTLLVLKSH